MDQPFSTLQAPNKEMVLHILREELPHLHERFGVTRVAIYGSLARGEPRPDSDVDLLVELSRPLGLEFVTLAHYLEDKLGLAVDLATFEALRRTIDKPYRRALAARVQEDLVDVETATR